MPDRRWILAIILFIAAGLIVFTFANPADDGTDNGTQLQDQIDEATEAVEQAEDSLLQADVNSARILVDDLPDGDVKDDLNERLDAVQAIIDATKAVEQAEDTGLPADITAARTLVNALPDGDVKDDLNARLDAIDVVAPVITLLGANPFIVALDGTYAEPGATATDNIDGVITSKIIRSGVINTGVLGTYTITYSVTDTAGNTGTATRTVRVTDQTAPVINVLGTNPLTIAAGSSYTDAGATATDNVDGTITARIVRTGSVNTGVVGTYTIRYTVTDIAGNTATRTRTVRVTDQTDPVITFVPTGNTTYAKSHTSVVTVTDLYGTVSASTLEYQWTTSTTAPTEASFVKPFTNGATITTPAGVSGIYYLWAIAKDGSGNTTIARSNAFYVDNVAPVITITGDNPKLISVCLMMCSYVDEGATALDAVDGDVTADIEKTGTVNRWLLGKYTITYTVSDSVGNEATANREVIVQPLIWFNPNEDLDYEHNQHSHVSVFAGWTLSDWANLDTSSFKYLWTTSTTQPADSAFIETWTPIFANDVKIESPEDLNGTYYLWVMGADIFGNKVYDASGVFNFDNTDPTVTFNPNGNTTYARTQSTVVIVTDNESGVNTSPGVLEYYWTKNSSTVAPADPSFHDDFTTGDTITKDDEGIWYLWIKAADKTGNYVKVRSNAFYIDREGPEITFSPDGSMSPHSTYDVTVTVTDDHSTIDATSLKYVWTHNDSFPGPGAFENTFTNGGVITPTGHSNGWHYLWIMAKDSLGNTSYEVSNKFNLSSPS